MKSKKKKKNYKLLYTSLAYLDNNEKAETCLDLERKTHTPDLFCFLKLL
jgi:hypothetical protein